MKGDAIVVLDAGKTLSKLSLWTTEGELIAREIYQNQKRSGKPFDFLDTDGIAAWLLTALPGFAQRARVRHIIPVAHGAGLAAIREGQLVHPPLDYEQAVPPEVSDSYSKQRDVFELTGSPRLAAGLNAGVQLYGMEQAAPGIYGGAVFVPLAQYWSWFLSGNLRSEITSLGCHTDLWAPFSSGFSPMAERFGWAEKFAPPAFAGDVIGTLRARLADATGLEEDVKIRCGLHDSNAALIAARSFPEMTGQDATVLSTGTWFVAMRTPAQHFDMRRLPADRDCLVNVDAWGQPVPSARFMGGREIETLLGGSSQRVDKEEEQAGLLAAARELIRAGVMIEPSFVAGCGPFPNAAGRWKLAPEDALARKAGACLYAALIANVCLDLIGARESIIVEGRFAGADVIVRALAALRPRDQIFVSNAENDVSFGALKLVNPELVPKSRLEPIVPLDANLTDYAAAWMRLAERAERLAKTSAGTGDQGI